jgi:hypothetical protein
MKFVFLVIVGVIGFTLMSCATVSEGTHIPKPDERTKFQGKWTNEAWKLKEGYNDFSYIFIGNQFFFVSDGPGDYVSINGTFQFTETTITFSTKYPGKWKNWSNVYTLNDNVLEITRDYQHPGGEYLKQEYWTD